MRHLLIPCPSIDPIFQISKSETHSYFNFIQRAPYISYNHCQLGVPYEQSDGLDKLIHNDRYAPECVTCKGCSKKPHQRSQSPSQSSDSDSFVENFMFTQNDMGDLEHLGQMTFPIKNRSKQ